MDKKKEEKQRLAENYFHGAEGYNCCQAILKTFEKKYSVDERLLREGQKYGGGRAEGGECGALYALKLVKEERYKEIKENLEKEVGSAKCKEIRGKGLISCKGCVKFIAKEI